MGELPNNWLRVSPIVRHSWEFLFRVETNKETIFDSDYIEKLSEKATHFNGVSKQILRNVALVDGSLIFLISSNGKLPTLLTIDISSLSFAMEALVLWTSISFVFLAINFLNSQGYEMMIRQWCQVHFPADPELVLASYVPNELFLRIFRTRLSPNFSADRLRPGKLFGVLNKFVTYFAIATFLLFPLMHMAVVYASLDRIIAVHNLGLFASWAVAVGAASANLFALLIVFLAFTSLPTLMVDMRMISDNQNIDLTKNMGPTSSAPNRSDEPATLLKKSLREASTIVAEEERVILNGLSKVDQESQIPILVRALAEMRITATFERVYGLSFGSQLKGLTRLMEWGEVTIDNAREFFQSEAKDRFPQFYVDKTFDQWLGFLVEHRLVLRAAAKIEITELGKEFLKFLKERNYSLDRFF